MIYAGYHVWNNLPPILLILSTLLCTPNGAKLAVGCELNERSVAGGQISHNPP